MERLTYRAELGVSIDKNEDCPTCSACWNCNIPPRKCGYISDALEKLAEYEDLEEQGRLIRIPCKVGDSIYSVIEDGLTIIELKFSLDFYVRRKNDIGKTVFLTKSEAEVKLKELRGGENE